MARRSKWQVFHRWAGLLFSVFLLVFCVSGIILNHRELFAGCDVNRSLLPASYHIKNFNNGSVRGTLRAGEDSVIAYGCNGAWLTDSGFSKFSDFNSGLPSGADRRNIKSIVRTADGTLWCAAQFGLYKHVGGYWAEVKLPGNSERLSDLTLTPDSTGVVALTRSAIYQSGAGGEFSRTELAQAQGHSSKISLFKTVWMLHSGELFGTIGKIVVDIAALIIIILSVTGIIIFILPYSIRRAARRSPVLKSRWTGALLKWNFRWHDRFGYWMLVLTLLIAVTGMCLRPPLMVPFVMTKTEPLPGSALDNSNPWHDRLRSIRFDKISDRWLISTSDGFITVDSHFNNDPVALDPSRTPPVSPMGVNVFEPDSSGKWIVGSFSGLFTWNPATGEVTDMTTGKPYERKSGGRPVSTTMVAGFSADLDHAKTVVFDYSRGADIPTADPTIISSQPMSLWNTALELHVGRCYNPFLGPLSDLFVFIAGLLLTLILISGYIVHRRSHRRIKNSERGKKN